MMDDGVVNEVGEKVVEDLDEAPFGKPSFANCAVL